MAAAPVKTALGSPPGWKLAPPLNARTQGLVATGFGRLPTGRALLLEFAWPDNVAGGAWLRALREVVEISDGIPDKESDRAASIAFTHTGLAYMGLDDRALASFARPFREGMFQEDRTRRLGDRRQRKWLKSVIADGPVWSANTPLRDPDGNMAGSTQAYAVPHASEPEEAVRTPLTVHAILLLYAISDEEADGWAARVSASSGRLSIDEPSALSDLGTTGPGAASL